MNLSFVLQPWQLFVLMVAGWLNCKQQAQTEFLNSRLRILLEVQGYKRIRLTNDQRRRLAVQGKAFGCSCLRGSTLPTPSAPTPFTNFSPPDDGGSGFLVAGLLLRGGPSR